MRNLLLALLLAIPVQAAAVGDTCWLVSSVSATSIAGGAITTSALTMTPGVTTVSGTTLIPSHLKIGVDLVDASNGVSALALTFTGANTAAGTYRVPGKTRASVATALTRIWDPTAGGKAWLTGVSWKHLYGTITVTPTGHGTGDTVALEVYGCTGKP